MDKVAYIFPGQGSQYIGMGEDLYKNSAEAKSVFDEAEKILPEVGIKKLCFQGPIEELTRTANSQVAILVVSIAALESMRSRQKTENGKQKTVACAGLSLGELTALVAAKAIEFRDAVRLVRKRGELMEQVSLKYPGAMASMIGISIEVLREICKTAGSEIANLNCPGQIVISGTKVSIEKSIEIASKKGAKKSIILNVSGAFHCSLMKEAAELFRIELDKVKFSVPEIGVVSNVTADYLKTPAEIKENLVKQLVSPVRWEESVRRIALQEVDTFYEIGPGKVLKGLLRRIDERLNVFNVEKMEDFNTVIGDR